MVRGKRNLLPPALLMLGFGLMFRVSDESKSKHVKHRLYDTEESTGTPARASATESPQRDATPERNTQEIADSDSDNDDDDEDQGDLQQRANPLQSNNNSRAQEDTTADALADLSLSKDQEPAAEDPAAEEPPTAEAGESSSESELEDDTTSRADTATNPSSTASKKPLKRGQRSKAKKMATKYKDQDDEDRELMESLLGVTAARQKAEAAAAAKAQREADAAAAQERRRQAQERAKKQVAEHEKLRQMMLEDDAEGPADDEEGGGGDSSLQALDGLVGTPLPGDEIVEVVPVCAPWSAMGRIKYKAKLQPGGTKKGKAVREVVDRWRLAAGKKGVVDEEGRDPEKMWPREVELIKGLKVEEAFNCVPVSKVTVMMAGGGSGGGGGGGGGSSRGQKKGRGGKGSKR